MLVSLTDGNGCQADISNITDNTIEANITVRALPTVQMTDLINGKDTICLGESKELVFTGVAPYNIEFRANGTTDQKTNIPTNTLLVPSEQTGSFGFKLVSLIDASGCTYDVANSTDTADIFVRELPTATMVASNQNMCMGDSISFISFTGTAPWSVTYNNGSTNIVESNISSPLCYFKPTVEGIYSFTLKSVSDAVCSDTATGNVTITVDTMPTATIIASSQDLCLGGNVDIISLTGKAPWTVTYNDGTGVQTLSGIMTSLYNFTPTVAGDYEFTLISVSDDNGCTNTATGSVTITVNPLPTVTLINSQTVTIGDNVNLMTLTGKAPWDVVYNDGTNDVTLSVNASPYVFTSTVAGIYTFNLASVSDANACTDMVSGSVTITVKAAVSNDASLANLSVSEGTLTPVFNKNVLNYTVNVANETDKITISAQATDSNATITGTGNFSLIIGENTFPVTVTAEDKITIKTYTIKVIRMNVGIEKIEIAENISIYPNPTRDMLYIVSDLEIRQMEIYDVNGKLVKQIVNPKQTVSIVELPEGIYMLQIQTDKGTAIKKVIKQ
jgi:hypothetical protein